MRDHQVKARQRARGPARRCADLVTWGHLAGALLIHPLAAQTPSVAPEVRARMDLLDAELRRHARTLGHDSLRGTAGDTADGTGERIARYVAEEFARLGLQPLPTPAGGWIHHVPRPGQRRFDYTRSYIRIMTVPGYGRTKVVAETGYDEDATRIAQADFVTAAHFLSEAGRPLLREAQRESRFDWSANFMGSSRVAIVAGPHTPATLAGLALRDRVVVYVPPAGTDSAALHAVLTQLAVQSGGVLVARDGDSAAFARAIDASRRPVALVEAYLWNTVVPDGAWRWAVALRSATLAGVWSAADVDVAALRRAATPVVYDAPGTQAWLVAEPANADTNAGRTLPYVAGVLEGADSVLKRQYVVVTANLGDADDSGLAGVLALARALSQPDVRPLRSIVFVATSGEPPLRAGSWFFARVEQQRQLAGRFVAALTLDHINPATASAVVIDGGREVALSVTPDRMSTVHPELGLSVADSGTVFQPGTIAYAYARNGVPSLAAYGSTPAPGSAPSAGMSDSMTRVVLLAFYLSQELANRPSLPRWTDIGRQRYQRALRLTEPIPDSSTHEKAGQR